MIPRKIFPVSVLKYLEICQEKVLQWSHFDEVAELPSTESIRFLEILRNSLLTGVPGWQSTRCNATTNELLTKFPKGLLKILENSQEELNNGVLF